ncbi:hypothetical protein [Desertimonas flava]|uniref:hypothetical protein n=1 Tax=Desertimonas flava TaxID=2064846 RepID=UPI000E34283E|nr:hypothetical protein [Desertimonas flava]
MTDVEFDYDHVCQTCRFWQPGRRLGDPCAHNRSFQTPPGQVRESFLACQLWQPATVQKGETP